MDKAQTIATATPESLLVSAREAAELLGVGKSLLYQMASDGRLGPVPILGSKYSRQELIDWVHKRCPAREQWLRMRGHNG